MAAPETRGTLFVVSAPSGAGKTTLCRRICELHPEIGLSVSHTTRNPRPGEKDGVDYVFTDSAAFRHMISAGEFLEWAEVHGNFYGTPRSGIDRITSSGRDVILDIDVQGARQIRQNYGRSTLIFVLPPSMETLRSRLFMRMSDSESVIRRRLDKAREEIRHYRFYDYVIVNNILDHAVRTLQSVILAEKARQERIDHNWVEETFFRED